MTQITELNILQTFRRPPCTLCFSVVTWIKQIVPQPVILPPGAVPVEPSTKSSCTSLDKSKESLKIPV